MGFSCQTEPGVTVNHRDESSGLSLECLREASATELCPIKGKFGKISVSVRQWGAVCGWSVRGKERFGENN